MLATMRLVFNATALIGLLVLAALLGIVATQAQDLPWIHLSSGRLLAEAGALPRAEALLFTAPASAAFDARAWGWDWAAFQGFKLYGAGVLRFLDALAVIAATLALAGAAFRRGARPFSTAAFTAWALLAARPDLSPGPELLAFAVFCTALWLMEGELWTAFFSRWIWLGPLAVLAVNASPAAWALAPLALLWLLFDQDEEGAPPQPRLAKALFFGLLLVCLCLHPQGPAALLRVPRSLGASPLLPGAFAQRQAGLLLLAASALLLVASSWTRAGRGHLGRDAALFMAFAAAAALSRSALPWSLALVAPLAATRFDMLVDALPAPLRALRWPFKIAALAALLFFGLRGGLAARLAPAAAAQPKPAQTLAFFEQELLGGNVLCPPLWTPWLAWKLAPNARFALDSRGAEDPARAQRLAGALDAEGDYIAALDKEAVGSCWLPLGSPLAVALATSQAWQPVSYDDASVLYVRADAANAELIKVHAPRGLRPGDPARPVESTRLAQAEADLETALARDPGLGVSYAYLAELWLAKGQEAKARQTLEAGIRADPGYGRCYARLAALRAVRGDKAAARELYQRALGLQADPAWQASLDALAQE